MASYLALLRWNLFPGPTPAKSEYFQFLLNHRWLLNPHGTEKVGESFLRPFHLLLAIPSMLSLQGPCETSIGGGSSLGKHQELAWSTAAHPQWPNVVNGFQVFTPLEIRKREQSEGKCVTVLDCCKSYSLPFISKKWEHPTLWSPSAIDEIENTEACSASTSLSAHTPLCWESRWPNVRVFVGSPGRAVSRTCCVLGDQDRARLLCRARSGVILSGVTACYATNNSNLLPLWNCF